MSFNEQLGPSNAVVDYTKVDLVDLIYDTGKTKDSKMNITHIMIVPDTRGVESLFKKNKIHSETDFIIESVG